MKKLVLAVIDGLKPSELERAVDTGRAPVLAQLMARGSYVDSCIAAFPSVTPVCAATIATGVRQDVHRIPGMNWYLRDEDRYVEYGSSFSASRRFGIAQQLIDTVYNMNHTHLPADVPTIFEALDDAGVRTAGTTYLIYRGRHDHKPSRETTMSRLASQLMRRTVKGPRELFYADLYASRETGCWSRLGMPGLRDQHTGCVGAYLVENDLCDFLLFSLPDNDTASHAGGPQAQVASIAAADRQMERLVHAGGGLDRFLDDHAVIVVADHSHSLVEQTIDFEGAFADFRVLAPSGRGAPEAEIALCPSQRSAQVYGLLDEARDALVPQLVAAALAAEGVDLVMHRAPNGRAVVSSKRGVVSFAPSADGIRDSRGARWAFDGDIGVLGSADSDDLSTPDYPDALGRVWAAVTCEYSGDILLSAAPGWEFADWGAQHHVGGGSHGALHASDSLGALVFCGVEPPPARTGADDGRAHWSIADVAPMALGHFGLAPDTLA